MKKTLSFLSAVALLGISAGTVFALPTITSYDDQNIDQKASSTLLYDITITDDETTAAITAANDIRVTIPDDLSAIFDSTRTMQEIQVFGTAVTNEKIGSVSNITFEDADKTIVIPVDQDFAPGESVTLRNVSLEGFHNSSNSKYLELSYGGGTAINNKYIAIITSANEDTTAPDAPTDIAIEQIDNTTVRLTWTDPTDLDLQFIDVLRSTGDRSVSATAYATVSPGVERYLDETLSVGETVNYILRGEDGPNLGDLSDEYSYTLIDMTEEEDPTDCDEGYEYDADLGSCVEIVEEEDPTDCDEGYEYDEEFEVCVEVEVVDDDEQQGEVVVITFSDVAGHWAYDEIIEMAAIGIVTGNPDGTFAPDGNLNRAEAAALIYRTAYEGEPELPLEKPFLDVDSGDWIAGYLRELNDVGLVKGNPDGTYEPAELINRAEFTVMAMNVREFLYGPLTLGVSTAPEFVDLPEDDWYTDLVKLAYYWDFVNGSDCGEDKCFYPEREITRAEATVILYGILNPPQIRE